MTRFLFVYGTSLDWFWLWALPFAVLASERGNT